MEENNIREEIRDRFGHTVTNNSLLNGIWDDVGKLIKTNLDNNIWTPIWDRIMSDDTDPIENGIKFNFFNTISPLTQQYIKQKIEK